MNKVFRLKSKLLQFTNEYINDGINTQLSTPSWTLKMEEQWQASKLYIRNSQWLINDASWGNIKIF